MVWMQKRRRVCGESSSIASATRRREARGADFVTFLFIVQCQEEGVSFHVPYCQSGKVTDSISTTSAAKKKALAVRRNVTLSTLAFADILSPMSAAEEEEGSC